jgi:N-acetylmuramoyl-L-alanine amidase
MTLPPPLLFIAAGWGWATGAPPDHASAIIPPRPAALALTVAGPPGRPLVVIDPGHGGHDPGSSARNGAVEKTVALALARTIRDTLLRTGAVRVALTRDDDHWRGLATRREAARALDPVLFLSIHCDSTADRAIHGASLYTLADRPTDASANMVAARENRADGSDNEDTGPDLPALLTSLAERETRSDARRFALRLGRALKPLGVLKPDWQRAALFKVLRAPDMPSVLVEAGYVSNAGDLRRLSSTKGREAFARAVAAAVKTFVAGRP